MGGRAAWVVGVGMACVLLATPARAQARVEVGVLAPGVGARVVVGAPRPYGVVRPYQPARAPYDLWSGKPGRKWAKLEREYYKDLRKARLEYEKDRRKAEREYLKDLRKARREYEKDRRNTRLDRRW